MAPASAVFISVYEPVKKWLQSPDSGIHADNIHVLGPMLAGAAAGSVSSLIRVPTEVIKQRLQTREFTSAIDAVGWREGGGGLQMPESPRAIGGWFCRLVVGCW